jgi:hypothetical protein
MTRCGRTFPGLDLVLGTQRTLTLPEPLVSVKRVET